MGGEDEQAAGRDQLAQLCQPRPPAGARQVAEQREREHYFVPPAPSQRLRLARGDKALHAQHIARELHGAGHHVGHGDFARAQRLGQMPREAPVAAGKFQKARHAQQGPVHAFEQQHQLRERAPAIGQVVAQRVDGGGVAVKEAVDVVLRRDFAVHAHPFRKRAGQAMTFH